MKDALLNKVLLFIRINVSYFYEKLNDSFLHQNIEVIKVTLFNVREHFT